MRLTHVHFEARLPRYSSVQIREVFNIFFTILLLLKEYPTPSTVLLTLTRLSSHVYYRINLSIQCVLEGEMA